MTRILISLTILSLCLWTTSCKNNDKDEQAEQKKLADKNAQVATCNIEPTRGNTARGTVVFTQTGNKVHVVADISGLKPNAKHGFHIHEGTECGEDGMKAGGHYNPEKHDHGLPNAPADKRHAGDFGNLQSDASGKAHFEATFDNITISGEKNPIVGHCMIVHANPDDGSQPVGNAGPRIGCGIIKAGGKVAVLEKHERFVLGYVISRPEIVTTLIPPQRNQISVSAAGGAAQAELQPDPGNVGWAMYQPAIRLKETGIRSAPGQFVLAQTSTAPNFSKEIEQVYVDAGVPLEITSLAYRNQANTNITVSTLVSSGRISAFTPATGPSTKSTTKTGTAK